MIKNKIIDNMKSFPKVDLHRHLEGSVRPETFIEVSKKYGGKLPSYDLDELRPLLQVNSDCCDFKNFLSKFNIYRDFYESSDAIQEVAYTAVKEAALDNVKYLELRRRTQMSYRISIKPGAIELFNNRCKKILPFSGFRIIRIHHLEQAKSSAGLKYSLKLFNCEGLQIVWHHAAKKC